MALKKSISSALFLVAAFILLLTPVKAQSVDGGAITKTPGAYVGINYADSDLDDVFVDTSGDGYGFTVGYRMNEAWRTEFQYQTIDYDNVTLLGVPVTNIKGDFWFLGVVWQSHAGDRDQWQPYARLAYADSEVKETQRSVTYKSTDDGFVLSFGVDYAVNENLGLRFDYSEYSDAQTVLSFGPIWHF